MPFAIASGTKRITVMSAKVTLGPLPTWAKTGEKVLFEGDVLYDTIPAMYETVEIYINKSIRVASGSTDDMGHFIIEWTVPFTAGGSKLPCNKWTFYAYHPSSGQWSSGRSMSIAYNTRISISAPSQVGANVPFTISGKLEYESSPGVWSPLAGKTVSIFYNGTKIADAVTLSDGTYKVSAKIPTPGSYTLKAQFGGEGLGTLGLGFAPTEVTFVSFGWWVPIVLAAAVPIATTVGTVVANEINKLAKRGELPKLPRLW